MVTTTPTSTTSPRARRLVLRLYFLTSAATLTMELVWIRMLRIACGGTVYSVAAVLSAYMLASACGALVAGRMLRRAEGLRLFGLSSLLASGAFLLSLGACFLAPGAFAFLAGGGGTVRVFFARAVLAAAVCAPGSFFAGMMCPALGGSLGGRRAFGMLHLFGCAGSAGGAAAAGLAGFSSLGVHGTAVLAVGCDAAVGLAAVRISRGGVGLVGDGGGGAFRVRPVLLAAFAAGAAMMASEVAFTRVLSAVLGSSVYSTTIVLSVFLAGLAGGGFWPRGSRAPGRRSPGRSSPRA